MTQLPALDPAPPRPRPAWRNWRNRRVVRAGVVLLAVFAIAELAVRLVVRPRLASDPHLLLRPPPPFFVGSDQHLEPMYVAAHPSKDLEPCPPFPVEKPPGTLRVV